MWYGDKRGSKVQICHALSDLGWKIYGYSPDESDSMTDYYCPASWSGIATKNGYVLNVDCWTSYSGRTITEKVSGVSKNHAKIKQLEVLAADKGATDGEKAAALAAIQRIQDREQSEQKECKVLEQWPEFQQNPPHCNWHIEKDGKIIAKGNGAFSFSELQYFHVDLLTGKPLDERRVKNLSDEDEKLLHKFQRFVQKLDSLASVKIGNGTDDEYEMQQITKFRTELKPEPISGTELKQGDHFQLMTYFTRGGTKGNVYQVVSVDRDMIFGVKMGKGYKKTLSGMSNAGNYFNVKVSQMEKWMSFGAIQKVALVEVNTPYTVEKCVKKTQSKTEKREHLIQYDIAESKDTRDGSQIWVVKPQQNLSKTEFKTVAANMKKGGGYYSKFCHGFLFRQDPKEFLQSC